MIHSHHIRGNAHFEPRRDVSGHIMPDNAEYPMMQVR